MTERAAVVAQAHKAIKALIKFEKEKEQEGKPTKNLLGGDDLADTAVWLVFGLDRVPEAKQVKPIRLSLNHPWREAEDEQLSVCLITKDPHAEYRDLVNPLGLKSISKIMGVTKLRTDCKPFEIRRQLCNAYDVFLADERVLPLLPKLLGKTFFAKKKIPIPVDLSKKKPEALRKELKSAAESTVLYLTSGPCTSVKIGLASQTAAQLNENAATVIEQVAKKVPGGWNNIRTIHTKTATSISLPVYIPQK